MCVPREVDVPWEAPNICQIIRSIPCKQNGYIIARVMILMLCTAQIIMTILMSLELEFTQDRNYIATSYDISFINIVLLYVHTCIVCIIGIDGIYMIHIMMFPIDQGFDAVWCFKYVITEEYENKIHLIYDVCQNMIYPTMMFMGHVVWKIKNLLLYIQMYRKAVSRYTTEAAKSAILERAAAPFLFFGLILTIFLIVTHTVDVLHHPNLSSMYMPSSAFAHAFFHGITLTLSMNMILVLDPKKRYLCYICQGKKSALEKWIVTTIVSLFAISISTFVMYCYSDLTYESDNPAVVLTVNMIDLMIPVLILTNYILMWYYTIEELKVDDLSYNEFELELHDKYCDDSSTFVGGDARVRGPTAEQQAAYQFHVEAERERRFEEYIKPRIKNKIEGL